MFDVTITQIRSISTEESWKVNSVIFYFRNVLANLLHYLFEVINVYDVMYDVSCAWSANLM